MKTYFDPATLKWHDAPLTRLERYQTEFCFTTEKGNTTEDGVKALSFLAGWQMDVCWERFVAIMGTAARMEDAKFPECVHAVIDGYVERARGSGGQL